VIKKHTDSQVVARARTGGMVDRFVAENSNATKRRSPKQDGLTKDADSFVVALRGEVNQVRAPVKTEFGTQLIEITDRTD